MDIRESDKNRAAIKIQRASKNSKKLRYRKMMKDALRHLNTLGTEDFFDIRREIPHYKVLNKLHKEVTGKPRLGLHDFAAFL